MNREPTKLKAIEVLNQGSLDESKYKASVGAFIDLIIDHALLEARAEFKEHVRRLEAKEPEEVKDHRSFGKVRNPGDPV